MFRELFQKVFGKGSTMPLNKRKLLLFFTIIAIIGYILGALTHSEIVHFFLGD